MGYWTASIALIAFGILGLMSIGLPFLMIGLAMALLSRVRHRPMIYWPIMAGLIAYNVALWAIMPFTCSASTTVGGSSITTCTSLIGIPWPSDETGTNVTPAAFEISNIIAGVVAFIVVAAVLGWLVIDQDKNPDSDGGDAA